MPRKKQKIKTKNGNEGSDTDAGVFCSIFFKESLKKEFVNLK